MFKATRGKNPVDLLQKFEDWLPEDGVRCIDCSFAVTLLTRPYRSTNTRLCTSTTLELSIACMTRTESSRTTEPTNQQHHARTAIHRILST